MIKKYTTLNPDNFSIYQLNWLSMTPEKFANVFFVLKKNFTVLIQEVRGCLTRDILKMISVIQLVEKINGSRFFHEWCLRLTTNFTCTFWASML